MERETLGPAGQRLSEAASSAGERLSEAASAAGERLMSVAEEKGLNAAGVKEVARDVADTFGKSFSGDQQQGNRTDQKQSATASGGGSQSGAGTMRDRNAPRRPICSAVSVAKPSSSTPAAAGSAPAARSGGSAGPAE
jgi:hypothetical protein